MRTQPLLAALLAALAVAPAFAKGPHAPGHGGDDRAAYAARQDGARGCPPGLAKKRNGCLPPGQAKKVYRDAMVGHHVPPHAVYAIPQRVRVTLPRPPAGYRYAVVNDQVVLVSRSDIVVDIIRDIIG